MKLPQARYADGIRKSVQEEFRGYDHNPGAAEGAIYDMENLSGDEYPLLSPRPRRRTVATLAKPGGLFQAGKLLWVDGTAAVYDGETVGTVTEGEKTIEALGPYIVIWPDKKILNTRDGSFGDVEAAWTGTELTFRNGSIYGEEAEANTLYSAGADFSALFRAGDAVEISGCTVHTENNKTPIIREISEDGHELRFYEHVFTLGEGNTTYTESGSLSVARRAPELDFLCQNENRLWGCKGDSIWCSKLGDPYNWYVFDGLGTDSFSVETGTPGDFTGCISFLGYPIFFKQNYIFKIYGDLPSNFQVMKSATMGVMAGSGKSLAVAGEVCFYLSRNGVCAYSGGIPTLIADAFGGESYRNAVGGSDGRKYYVSMADSAGAWQLFVYDPARGFWHREDGLRAAAFAMGENLLCLTAEGKLLLMGRVLGAETLEEEGPVSWWAEFCDTVEGELNKKHLKKLQLRCELEAGSRLAVKLRFEGETAWTTVGETEAAAKKEYFLPVPLRRCDHYRLRVEGTGKARLYAMAREYAVGSERR